MRPLDVCGKPIEVGSRIVYATRSGNSGELNGPATAVAILHSKDARNNDVWKITVQKNPPGCRPSVLHYPDRIAVVGGNGD